MIPGPIFLGLAGWLATVGFGVTLCLPLGLKLLGVDGGSWRAVMRLHYPLGLSILAIAFAHAWIPLTSGQLGRVFGLGIASGFAAYALMVVQCGLGIALYRTVAVGPALRRTHLATMAVLVMVIALHAGLYVLH